VLQVEEFSGTKRACGQDNGELRPTATMEPWPVDLATVGVQLDLLEKVLDHIYRASLSWTSPSTRSISLFAFSCLPQPSVAPMNWFVAIPRLIEIKMPRNEQFSPFFSFEEEKVMFFCLELISRSTNSTTARSLKAKSQGPRKEKCSHCREAKRKVPSVSLFLTFKVCISPCR
jgi:hypothetical protein